jgi:hypothetical protein
VDALAKRKRKSAREAKAVIKQRCLCEKADKGKDKAVRKLVYRK